VAAWWAGGQWHGRPAGQRPACSFSLSWYGEASHGIGAQGAEVSALPGAVPQPRMSPASEQGP
jgi:hypothetical protein